MVGKSHGWVMSVRLQSPAKLSQSTFLGCLFLPQIAFFAEPQRVAFATTPHPLHPLSPADQLIWCVSPTSAIPLKLFSQRSVRASDLWSRLSHPSPYLLFQGCPPHTGVVILTSLLRLIVPSYPYASHSLHLQGQPIHSSSHFSIPKLPHGHGFHLFLLRIPGFSASLSPAISAHFPSACWAIQANSCNQTCSGSSLPCCLKGMGALYTQGLSLIHL